MKKLLLAVLALVSLSIGAQAAVPAVLNFTGKLTDVDGSAITAPSTAVTIKIYDALTSGTLLYTEADTVNPDNDGVFSLSIGNVTPLSGVNFNQALFVEITVAGNALTPRYTLASSPYSLRSENANTATTATTASAVAFTGITGVPATLTNSLAFDVNTASGLVKLTSTGKLPVLDGSALTGVSATSVAAANVTAGVLPVTVVISSAGANSVNDAAITGVSSSKLTGNLPALNGSALTNLTAGNITAGGTLPAVNGAAVTNLNPLNLTAATLPLNVPASSTTANSVNDAAIVSVSASKLTGSFAVSALPTGYQNLVLLSSTTLGSAASSLVSTTFVAKKRLIVMINSIGLSATSIPALRLNGDTAANYAGQTSDNGSNTTLRTADTTIRMAEANIGTNASNFEVHIMNVSASRKVVNFTGGSDLGAPATAPSTFAGTGVWNNTSSQITSITLVNENAANTVGAGNFSAGTQMFVFGAE